jgi:hypothetical protein
MPRKKLEIPAFKNEREEAEWWEKHRATVEADLRAARRGKKTQTIQDVLAQSRQKKELHPVTIRLPQDDVPSASQEQTRERAIERWMLTSVKYGGVDRFDDLHVDRIDELWRNRETWVIAGLQAFKTAAILRTRHQLPVVVALAFSVESSQSSNVIGFETIEELESRLDWSPPSLYLFHPGKTPCDETTRALVEKAVEGDVIVHKIQPNVFGAEVSATRAYYMVFRPTGSSENTQSVFIEG